MVAINTVLCPVDFLPATARQVDLAADLCRAFGARLVLHHNVQSLGIAASVGWMRNADRTGNPQAAAEEKLRECIARVPQGIEVEPLITQGPNSQTILNVADVVEADLLLLTTHGTMSEDHASVTEQVLERGGRAVLVLHEAALEARTPHFASASTDRQVVVAPTDLSPGSRPALQLGIDLARALPIELHLLHFLPNGRGREGTSEEQARTRLQALVPDDLRDRTKVHVEHGKPGEGIVRAAQQLSAACIVMGESPRNALRRWFGDDTSRTVLHEARCPVWYVPPARAS